ncbi:MAG: hypothetical protein Q9167_000682 [Letrouitia subvulpina]
MADALCGPSNPLRDLQKHASVDRTLQYNPLSVKNGTTEHFRSQSANTGVLDAEFEAFQAGYPLSETSAHLDNTFYDGNASLTGPSLVSPPSSSSAWASDFENSLLNRGSALLKHQSLSNNKEDLRNASPSGWHQEFLRQQSPVQGSWSLHSRTVFGQNDFNGQNPLSQFSQLNNSHPPATLQKQPGGKADETFDESAFERAFDAVTLELHKLENATQQDTNTDDNGPVERGFDHNPPVKYRIGSDRILDDSLDQRTDNGKENDADDLARTAGQLLENVKHDQSTKFQKSNFLALMRQLRDKEVKIEGDKIVDVSPTLQGLQQ